MEKADDLFEKYSKELEIDTQVDVTNLMDKQYSLPHVRNKWLYRLRGCQKNYHRLVDAKNEFISKQIADTPVQLSSAKISKKVESDPNYKKLVEEIRDYESLIAYLDANINKNLNSMGFDIKNIIELMKLETL